MAHGGQWLAGLALVLACSTQDVDLAARAQAVEIALLDAVVDLPIDGPLTALDAGSAAPVDAPVAVDAGVVDAGGADAPLPGVDAGGNLDALPQPTDGGPTLDDGGTPLGDGGVGDGGIGDGGVGDGGVGDGGVGDGGVGDGGVGDGGVGDGGVGDGGVGDGGVGDGGVGDGGVGDGGVGDGGVGDGGVGGGGPGGGGAGAAGDEVDSFYACQAGAGAGLVPLLGAGLVLRMRRRARRTPTARS